MNQAKIGRFIASCRKERGMTQAALAERLGISDRAVSKWETGRSMPDSGIMLELCDLLGINVNELLSGERIMEETYGKRLEENLLDLTRQREEKDRQMLRLEVVIGYTASISFLTLVFVASFIEMPTWLRVLLIAVGAVIFLVGCCSAVRIEQTAGFYECPNCGNKYVPSSYSSVLWAMHFGRTRKMTCPACGERGWHKKVLSDE